MKDNPTKEQLEQAVTVTLRLRVALNINRNDDSIFVEPARPRSLDGLPAIGAAYQGGVYAGLSIENGRPVALALLPGDEDPLMWDKAAAWAEKQGGAIPSRIDQLVLFQNLKSEFKNIWYWSGEPCAGTAGTAGSAWCQPFPSGDQYYDRKDYELRARAVRRLPIE